MTVRSTLEWQNWLSDVCQGQNEEAWCGIQCFFRWIEVRAANGHAVPSFLQGLEEDLRHSALLRRLISGKEPLPEPPPESFGQPWYELIEKGWATAEEVKPWEWDPQRKLSINRGIWNVVEQVSEVEFVVTRKEGSELYRVGWEGEKWVIQKIRSLAPSGISWPPG